MTGLWRGDPLVLASQSRVRQDLLTAACIPFEIQAAAIDERGIESALKASGADASGVALQLSRAKAVKVSSEKPAKLVIGADQVLCLDERLFSKPVDRAAAVSQLQALSGRTHELYSGCCAVRESRVLFETVSVARLRCRKLSPQFIETYLDQAGGFDSVGVYRIEGPGIHLFDAIEGDHSTILGLPLLPLLKFLREEGSLL